MYQNKIESDPESILYSSLFTNTNESVLTHLSLYETQTKELGQKQIVGQ